jgi:STE24 endopeptidase
MIRILGLLALLNLLVCPVLAQSGPAPAPTSTVDVHTLPPVAGPLKVVAFDPVKATNAYLAQIHGAARANSDAYFEGGYILQAIRALYALVVAGILLWSKLSAGIRDFSIARTRSRFWQVPIYAGIYIVVTAVLTLPLTIYEDFFREKAYGLMNLTFAGWFGQVAISFGLALVAGMVLLTLLYVAIRRAPRTWWLWGAAITIVFAAFVALVEPVFVAPLYNTYSALPESKLKSDILSVARANGIPADNVYVDDASKQSDRISANVSGLFSTTRITLNDNLLHKGTHDEVLAVLGHEMGHYVLDHVIVGLIELGIVILLGFAFAAWGFRTLTNLFGGSWGVRTIDDPAGLPVLAALATVFFFVMTPVTNTIIRTAEIQADMFGINAVRKPDAFATVVLKLSNYRKLDPGPWEEFILYDHPSGHTRVWEMMRWKAEHLNDPDIKAGPVSPQ